MECVKIQELDRFNNFSMLEKRHEGATEQARCKRKGG
jgi:hypothetical protein